MQAQFALAMFLAASAAQGNFLSKTDVNSLIYLSVTVPIDVNSTTPATKLLAAKPATGPVVKVETKVVKVEGKLVETKPFSPMATKPVDNTKQNASKPVDAAHKADQAILSYGQQAGGTKVKQNPVTDKVGSKPVAADTKPAAEGNEKNADSKPVVKPLSTKVEVKAAGVKVEVKPVAAEVEAKPAAAKAAAKVTAPPKPATQGEKSTKAESAAPKIAAQIEQIPDGIAKSVDASPHAILQVSKQQAKNDPTTQENALSAQASADEATHHLENAKKAFEKTKANVKEILKTGKKIENTADDIKTLYTPDDKLAAEEAKEEEVEATAQPAPAIDIATLQAREQEEAQRDYLVRVVAQLIFALLYYVLIVRHYPSYRELPPPNSEAKELQAVDELSATCHASLSNLFLSWCCSGPRAAHTFYSVIGFNYWVGCMMTTCFPCCTLWYFNTFTKLNERLGGEKRSIPMGLLCACCCSCCVIAQDAETLDRIHGLETLPWGIQRRRYTAAK